MKSFLSIFLLLVAVLHADTLRSVRLSSVAGGDTLIALAVTDSSGSSAVYKFNASTLTAGQQTTLNNFINYVNGLYVGSGESQGCIVLNETGQQAPASYGTATRTYTDKLGADYQDTYRTIVLPLHDIIQISFVSVKAGDRERVSITNSELMPTTQRNQCIGIWNACDAKAASL